MSSAAPPVIECEQQHPELCVSDVDAAVEFYTNILGFTPGFTWGRPPSIAGVNLGSVQLFLKKGTPNPAGCSVYFVVGNADELAEFQRGSGAEFVVEPADREYGLRDYRIRDLYGYELSFGHRIFTEGAAIEIERVDMTIRLERRLAALLQDLAAFKRMTVGSCLEETLLHTLDGVGPHTKTELRHIETLKRKHAIDYDTHASYRFVERSSGA